jgi:hypothetical protein
MNTSVDAEEAQPARGSLLHEAHAEHFEARKERDAEFFDDVSRVTMVTRGPFHCIFLLTSFFIDSIHSISRNRRSLHSP